MAEPLRTARRALTALALLAAPCGAQQGLETLRVGHWVEAKGALLRPGVFGADELEVLAPDDEEALLGTVERVLGSGRFVLLGQEVQIAAGTRWSGVDLAHLAGARVKVEGEFLGGRRFEAEEISARGPGRDRIEGRVDGIERRDGVLELSIMGWKVRVEADESLDSEAPLAELALAPERQRARGGFARDDDDEVRGSIRLGETLTLGGQLEAQSERQDDFDLDDADAEDRLDGQLSLRAELFWAPSEDFFALASGRTSQRWRDDEEDGRSRLESTVLNEAYGYWRDLAESGFDVQLGRADFDDPREWLYDENLDTLRVIRTAPSWRLELSASTVLAGGSQSDEDTTNWILYLSNGDTQRHAALYALLRDHEAGDRPLHLGGRVLGEWLDDHDVWLELALLRGDSLGERAEGEAFDVGTTWSPEALEPVYLSAGYAFGSGDETSGDGRSDTFRQSGFHDNNAKLGGVTSFRYYGELVEPELANLGILTLGAGVRPTRRTSLDLVAHRYVLDQAADQLYGSNLDRDPDGVHPDLGWEVDLVYGNRAAESWSFEAVLGAFEPGAALPGADRAWLAAVQVRFKF